MSRDVNKMGKFVREMGAIVDFKVSFVLNMGPSQYIGRLNINIFILDISTRQSNNFAIILKLRSGQV